MSKINKFWENCDLTFAHITADRWLVDKQSLTNSFKGKMGPFDPIEKVVVDYGIGAAHLGLYVLGNNLAKMYIGIDIAQRSLDAAKECLSIYDNVSLILAPVDFSTLNADIFTSFAVIQHFPDQGYLNDFLDNVNLSNIPELAMQIRHSDKNEFSDNYETQNEAMMGCRTNKEYMLSKLTKYTCISESKIDHKSGYHYLYFKIKKIKQTK